MMLDYLCDDCRKDFEDLKKHLDAMGIKYVVDPTIVRGLDYYTKTAFEFITTKIGAQGTVCGGGRYDHLIEEVGGPDMPIVVVLGTKIPGTMSEFKKKIMDDKEYSPQAVEVATATDIKRTVTGTPGAIGIGARAQIDDSVYAPHYPAPTRVITLLTKVDRPAEIDRVVQYILGPGRKILQ